MFPVLIVYYKYGLSPEVAFNKKKLDLNLKKKKKNKENARKTDVVFLKVSAKEKRRIILG